MTHDDLVRKTVGQIKRDGGRVLCIARGGDCFEDTTETRIIFLTPARKWAWMGVVEAVEEDCYGGECETPEELSRSVMRDLLTCYLDSDEDGDVDPSNFFFSPRT